MPNCFTLTRKSETEPAILQGVDDAMREHFKVESSNIDWYKNWYDTVGLRLALGWSFSQIRDDYVKSMAMEQLQAMGGVDTLKDQQHYKRMVEIVDWLDANYTTDAFYTHGGVH